MGASVATPMIIASLTAASQAAPVAAGIGGAAAAAGVGGPVAAGLAASSLALGGTIATTAATGLGGLGAVAVVPAATGGISLGAALGAASGTGSIVTGLMSAKVAREAGARAREQEVRVREGRRQQRIRAASQAIGFVEAVRGATGGGATSLAEGEVQEAGDMGVDLSVIDDEFSARIAAINARLRSATSMTRLGAEAVGNAFGAFATGTILASRLGIRTALGGSLSRFFRRRSVR